MTIKRVPTLDAGVAWDFASRWYEDHRKIKVSELKIFYRAFPFKGTAFRYTETAKLGVGTSWSKSFQALQSYQRVAKTSPYLYTETVDGIDLEAMAKLALTLDSSDSDMWDIVKVREVIKMV